MSAQRQAPAASGDNRRRLLAHLHCLRRDAGWSEDEYRDILHARTGQRSASDLDFVSLYQLVGDLAPLVKRRRVDPTDQERTSKPARAGDWAFIDRASQDKRPLLRKIFATCRALGAGRSYAEGVARRQSGGVARRLEMMSYDELHKVAAALATTQRAKASKATTAAPGQGANA